MSDGNNCVIWNLHVCLRFRIQVRIPVRLWLGGVRVIEPCVPLVFQNVFPLSPVKVIFPWYPRLPRVISPWTPVRVILPWIHPTVPLWLFLAIFQSVHDEGGCSCSVREHTELGVDDVNHCQYVRHAVIKENIHIDDMQGPDMFIIITYDMH